MKPWARGSLCTSNRALPLRVSERFALTGRSAKFVLRKFRVPPESDFWGACGRKIKYHNLAKKAEIWLRRIYSIIDFFEFDPKNQNLGQSWREQFWENWPSQIPEIGKIKYHLPGSYAGGGDHLKSPWQRARFRYIFLISRTALAANSLFFASWVALIL